MRRSFDSAQRYDRSDCILLERKDDMRKRGVASPDDGDALALTFAYPVASNDPVDLSIALQPTMLVQVKQHPSEIVCAEFPFKSCCPKLIGVERCRRAASSAGIRPRRVRALMMFLGLRR